MAVLPIITGQDTPVLRTKTARVGKPTKEVLSLAKDMLDTVRHAEGLGIAAPQVGKSLRMCIAKLGSRLTLLVDPDITWKSETMDLAEEGCLSLPGLWMDVPRPTEIVLRYVNARGEGEERRLSGQDARVVQHEVDHLDGILITDYQLPGIMNAALRSREAA